MGQNTKTNKTNPPCTCIIFPKCSLHCHVLYIGREIGHVVLRFLDRFWLCVYIKGVGIGPRGYHWCLWKDILILYTMSKHLNFVKKIFVNLFGFSCFIFYHFSVKIMLSMQTECLFLSWSVYVDGHTSIEESQLLNSKLEKDGHTSLELRSIPLNIPTMIL